MATRTPAAKEDTENRRARLRQWIADHYDGVQAKFVAAKSLNQGEISGLLGSKSFGSVKARTLEQQAGMPARYLDARDDDAQTVDTGATASRIDFVLRDSAGGVYVVECKTPMAGEPSLSPDEAKDLMAAVLDLPRSKAKELLAQVMMDAEEYRQYGRNVLKRFGAVGGAAVRKAEVETPIQSEGAAPDQSVMTLNPKPRKLPAHRAISSTLSRRKRDDTEKKAESK